MDNRVGFKSKDGEDFLSYYVDKKFLYRNYEAYEKFIEGVENIVRAHPRYTQYVGFLRNEKGLNSCAFMGVMSDEGMELEMHHGPIFNLFDVCDIVTRYYIHKEYNEINTFFIAKKVLDAHDDNTIQIVAMSKMIHQSGVHGGQFFLHIKSAYGRIDKFIDKYSDGMTEDHINNALYYLDMCKEFKDNLDNGLLEVAKEMKSFKNAQNR